MLLSPSVLLTVPLIWLALPSHASPAVKNRAHGPGQAGVIRDLNLRIENAGMSGSSPYSGVEVLVGARGQVWRKKTDDTGTVSFSALPCGGTVRVKVLNGEQPSRTLLFPCQQAPLHTTAFIASLCPASLQLMAKEANLTAPLPGIVTQRIRFRRGAVAAVINGSVAEGGIDNYLLTARKGQEMSVHIVSLDEQNPVSFDTYFLRDTGLYIKALGAKAGCIANENVRDFKGILPASGDYVISVYADGKNGQYSLDVIVQ